MVVGKGTGSGGTDGPNVVVTNQQLLVLPRSGLCDLTDEQQHALTLVELKFAHDVSARAAAAYKEIITLVERGGPSRNPDTDQPK